MGISQATPTCNLVFDKCPGAFTTGSITVPQNVIWLDPVVPVCTENVQVVTGTKGAPPSIMFIIDNSGSMSNGDVDNHDNGASDPDEQRFTVTKTLLDKIATSSPDAEVGLVIFTRRLQFDNRDNPFFKSAFPNDTSQHDAFIPLTSLNKVFPDGRKAVDSLKAFLEYTGNGNLTHATKQLASRPNTGVKPDNIRDGTDITLGFEAAKLAMKDAKAAKGDQYFIFLSDGLPSGPDTPRLPMLNDFVNGTATPTTFTVFFVPGSDPNPQPPTKIVTMTDNIKANNYSPTNTKSAYWAVNQGSQLLTLIQSNVLDPIFANTPAKPKSAVMTVNNVPLNNTSLDATNFTFGKRVPLNADQTTINLVYSYTYTDSGVPKTKDVPYVINVKRSGTAPLADGLSANCSEPADISLVYQNQPITKVTADHTSLDVYLTLPSGEACANCKVQVTPNKSADKESISLNPIGTVEVGTFKRETSNTPAPGDGILQNLPSDSIVITWINPDNALEIVRKAFPYSDIATALQVLQHNDVAKAQEPLSTVPGQHFVLVAPASLNATPGEPGKNWSVLANLSAKDSASVVGIELEASRAFRVTISVYSNLGQFVNKIDFSITQAEFDKLNKGLKNNTRKLSVLWDNRAEDGSLAGTGAYILKTEVTLLRIPGIADDQVVRSDYRLVGVLRKH